MRIEQIIGDYQAFVSDLTQRCAASSIPIENLRMSHLLYRVSSLEEYGQTLEALMGLCDEFVETKFNGRPIAILILKKPLVIDALSFSTLELPAPREGKVYPSGLESMGVVVGSRLPAFAKEYERILTGIKDQGNLSQPAFLTFDNGKTVKFYDISIQELMIIQGRYFQKITSRKING
jgi:predicted metalloenzyme YecM